MRGEFSDYVIWWIAVGVLVEIAFTVPTKYPEQRSELLRYPDDCNPGTVCESSSNAPGCEAGKSHLRTKHGNQDGFGYSADSEQITPQRCFNIIESSVSILEASIVLNSAMTSSELADKLGLSTSISGGYEIFSTDAKAKYMRLLEDHENAISFNYHQYTSAKVALQIGGSGDKALTESGKDFYKNGTNPYFGLQCGDYYISSYQTGVLLTMGLIIKFSSSSAKEKFSEKAKVQYGNIKSVAERVQYISAKNNITGSVIIQAFQIGGETSQLSEILTPDDNGNYYALSCNLQAMGNCIKITNSLLDYLRGDFRKQLSVNDKTGFMPLGLAFTEYHPIEWLGLNAPISLVTPEIVQHRRDLSSKLKENQYYQQKLYPFLNGAYPIQLAKTFIDNVRSISSKADSNVHVLMNKHRGAADCFKFPDKCTSIKARIDSQLQNITISDLKFLENIKYSYATSFCMIYNTGDSPNSWTVLGATVAKCSIVAKTDTEPTNRIANKWNGGDVEDPNEIKITLDCFFLARDPFHIRKNTTAVRNLSPFFFEAYNPEKI